MLLRGFFATPVISSLGRLGVLDAMTKTSDFNIDNFPNAGNKKLLADTFRYLARLGLLYERAGDSDVYNVSEMGEQIFKRANSFYVPHSYLHFMYNYHELLENPSMEINQEVEKLENVLGSGKTHQRYFYPAISYLKRMFSFEVIADLGCGNGHFISTFLKNIPNKKVVGIDISQISVDITRRNLREQFPNLEIKMICSDALDVEKWGDQLKNYAGTDRIAISMWFLLHEISSNNSDKIIQFFWIGHAVIQFRTCGLYVMPLIVDDTEQAVAIVFCGGQALVKNKAIGNMVILAVKVI